MGIVREKRFDNHFWLCVEKDNSFILAYSIKASVSIIHALLTDIFLRWMVSYKKVPTMCFHLFVNPCCTPNSVALQPSNISHRIYRVRREFCRLKTLRKYLKMREINEENPIPLIFFRAKCPIPPKKNKVKYPIPPKFYIS